MPATPFTTIYLQGTKNCRYEIAEQFGWRVGSEFSVFMLVDNVDLLLGIHLGFQELALAGITEGVPHLVAVQALACVPIYSAAHGLGLSISHTIAEGVAVENPPRLQQIVDAVHATDGDILAVSEPAILNAVDVVAN